MIGEKKLLDEMSELSVMPSTFDEALLEMSLSFPLQWCGMTVRV